MSRAKSQPDESSLDPFGLAEFLGGGEEEEPEEVPQAAEPDWKPPSREQWEAQQREAEELRRRADTDRDLLRNMISGRQPASAAPTPPAPAAPAPPPIDFSQMPDPTTEPDQHRAWWAKQVEQFGTAVNAEIDRRTAEIERRVQTQTQNSRADTLLARFIERYPAMRGRRAYIDAAAIAAGVKPTDPEETIFEKTAAQLRADGLLPAEGEGEPAPEPRAPTPQALGVGSGSGSARRRAKESDERQPTSFERQLMESQTKLGIA